MRAISRVGALLLVLIGLSACEGKRVAIVDEKDDKAADFGRGALIDAVVRFSKTPDSPQAYLAFAARVEELMPIFNRDVRREAKLRLSVLAISPLQAAFDKPHSEQMELFATTIWPSILGVDAEEGETASDYARGLCLRELALDCNDVVPEYWPVIINARVWRELNNRVGVGYDRCRWCQEDPNFDAILTNTKSSHVQVELLAREAQQKGRRSAWPRAGSFAAPLQADLIISFRADGWVTIEDRTAPGGNWRKELQKIRDTITLLGLHFRPERMVGDLLHVLQDANESGYKKVALVTREKRFPYDAKQYVLDTTTKTYQHLGVHNSDTIQILVQALDLVAQKQGASEAKAN